ncbi:hypothetical protein [Flavobacterium sedimenticola]|uniref:Uncharacterized protein n=1 Tax=Flavobacterium sedimenticola TaxID=3043286 RepID=A0ABT6XQL2_9FLAO|nr:hypothetical protein [Flavobacterium sedimenticola]MDI9257280.1 hypothetical protein [Flavobacterium sedimenticola]
MFETFKNIADSNNWYFEYGRQDYHNLYQDVTSGGTIHFFLEPIITDSIFSDSGYETLTYSGKFMLFVSSDVDETYTDKYNNHIKPIIENSLKTVKNSLLCNQFDINKFQVLEVINVFDTNVDGVLVNYSLKSTE